MMIHPSRLIRASAARWSDSISIESRSGYRTRPTRAGSGSARRVRLVVGSRWALGVQVRRPSDRRRPGRRMGSASAPAWSSPQEPRGGQAELLGPAVDDRQRAARAGRSRNRTAAERPGLDLARQGRPRQDRHARRDLDGALDVLDVVELERHLDVDLVVPEEPVDGPADRAGRRRSRRTSRRRARATVDRRPGRRTGATGGPPAPSPPRARGSPQLGPLPRERDQAKLGVPGRRRSRRPASGAGTRAGRSPPGTARGTSGRTGSCGAAPPSRSRPPGPSRPRSGRPPAP